METEIVSRSQRYWSLAQAFLPPADGATRDLSLAYTRLFFGPGRPTAHPYESVFIEGRMMGEAAAQVVECYAEAGLQVSNYSHELPDHVTLELAYMAYLVAQEANDTGKAKVWRDRQYRFLHGHLARWLPQFCERIEASEANQYYRAVARELKELIEEDVATLTPHFPRIENRAIPSTRPQRSKSSQTSSSTRYPNIHLDVDLSMCTLCTLCADSCKVGALTVESTATSLSLVFNPAFCNGCRLCLRLCPEEAISIRRGIALAAPRSSSRGVVSSAQRVVCPDCQSPHIAVPWLERLAERLGDRESVRHSLARCPACKAISRKNSPGLGELAQESSSRVQ